MQQFQPFFPVVLFVVILFSQPGKRIFRVILVQYGVNSVCLHQVVDEGDRYASQFRPEIFHKFHREVIQRKFSPSVAFPETENESFPILLDVYIHVIADKVAHFIMQSRYSFRHCESRCMYRFLFHKTRISEKGITQVLVVFPRDQVARLSVRTFREQFRRRHRRECGVQKRITAPLGAAIRFFLSVP
jgi:hypothetical protein